MTGLLAQATVKGPHINWDDVPLGCAPPAGACIVLLVGLARSSFIRRNVVPVLTLITLGVMLGLLIWQWDVNEAIVAKAPGRSTARSESASTMYFVAGGIAAGGVPGVALGGFCRGG